MHKPKAGVNRAQVESADYLLHKENIISLGCNIVQMLRGAGG